MLADLVRLMVLVSASLGESDSGQCSRDSCPDSGERDWRLNMISIFLFPSECEAQEDRPYRPLAHCGQCVGV